MWGFSFQVNAMCIFSSPGKTSPNLAGKWLGSSWILPRVRSYSGPNWVLVWQWPSANEAYLEATAPEETAHLRKRGGGEEVKSVVSDGPAGSWHVQSFGPRPEDWQVCNLLLFPEAPGPVV